MVELLRELQDYTPEIPDGVLVDLLAEQGFETDDPTVRKLIALATRKFLSEIANDAIQIARNRVANDRKARAKEFPVTVMPSDLAEPLASVGIHLAQPEYLADKPTTGLK